MAAAAQRVLAALVVVVAAAAVAATRPEPAAADSQNLLDNVPGRFQAFLTTYGRNYSSPAEYAHRLAVFTANLVRAVENQALDPTAVHGITQFSDLTEDEFARYYLGLRMPAHLAAAEASEDLPVGELPDDFDWRDRGAVTPVKNQGMCGSCWAFSAVGAVEGAHYLATGDLVSLSEQQLVDCDHQCDPEIHEACDSGCQGGLMNNAFEYLETAGGLDSEADYPYEGVGGTCRFDKDGITASLSKYKRVSVDEDQIAAHLVKYGPLAVGINAAWMQTYIAGVSCPLVCNKRGLNHGVLLVGYAKEGFAPLRMKEKPFWIIKNSWGSLWGNQGFYHICRGLGECGLNTMVSAVVAAEVNQAAVSTL
eukprot:SM000032S12127  [mRNA]  locus=s32:592821:594618:- [translate_table: standard]